MNPKENGLPDFSPNIRIVESNSFHELVTPTDLSGERPLPQIYGVKVPLLKIEPTLTRLEDNIENKLKIILENKPIEEAQEALPALLSDFEAQLSVVVNEYLNESHCPATFPVLPNSIEAAAHATRQADLRVNEQQELLASYPLHKKTISDLINGYFYLSLYVIISIAAIYSASLRIQDMAFSTIDVNSIIETTLGFLPLTLSIFFYNFIIKKLS